MNLDIYVLMHDESIFLTQGGGKDVPTTSERCQCLPGPVQCMERHLLYHLSAHRLVGLCVIAVPLGLSEKIYVECLY